MLDRVTPRQQLREELITITRMLMGQTPQIKGDLPGPDAARDKDDTGAQTTATDDGDADVEASAPETTTDTSANS